MSMETMTFHAPNGCRKVRKPVVDTGLFANENGFFLLGVLVILAVAAILATAAPMAMTPEKNRQAQQTAQRFDALKIALCRYRNAMGDFPSQTPSGFLDVMGPEPHALDALAVNPYGPGPGGDPEEAEAWQAWESRGPFIGRVFMRRSYLYDGSMGIVTYRYPYETFGGHLAVRLENQAATQVLEFHTCP